MSPPLWWRVDVRSWKDSWCHSGLLFPPFPCFLITNSDHFWLPNKIGVQITQMISLFSSRKKGGGYFSFFHQTKASSLFFSSLNFLLLSSNHGSGDLKLPICPDKLFKVIYKSFSCLIFRKASPSWPAFPELIGAGSPRVSDLSSSSQNFSDWSGCLK